MLNFHRDEEHGPDTDMNEEKNQIVGSQEVEVTFKSRIESVLTHCNRDVSWEEMKLFHEEEDFSVAWLLVRCTEISQTAKTKKSSNNHKRKSEVWMERKEFELKLRHKYDTEDDSE